MVIKELYNHSGDINAEKFAFDLSNNAKLQDKVKSVYDFFGMVEDTFYDMESGKDVLSNTYEKEQFLAELEIAESMFEDIMAVLDECEDVINDYLVGN